VAPGHWETAGRGFYLTPTIHDSRPWISNDAARPSVAAKVGRNGIPSGRIANPSYNMLARSANSDRLECIGLSVVKRDVKTQIDQFLALRKIAFVGLSHKQNHYSRAILKKLLDRGIVVFPVNPNHEEIDGLTCYPDLASLPEPVEGIFLTTRPDISLKIMQQAKDVGIAKAWTHRSFGKGSWSQELEAFCRDNGIELIPAGCPMMFVKPVDPVHGCFRWFMGVTGKL
jgi:predicted CoA-binding protein